MSPPPNTEHQAFKEQNPPTQQVNWMRLLWYENLQLGRIENCHLLWHGRVCCWQNLLICETRNVSQAAICVECKFSALIYLVYSSLDVCRCMGRCVLESVWFPPQSAASLSGPGLGSDHFIIGRGAGRLFEKNNLALFLVEKTNSAQSVCWKFFCFDMLQKKIMYRIYRGAETAVYQAWVLKKIWPSILWKKDLASNGV